MSILPSAAQSSVRLVDSAATTVEAHVKTSLVGPVLDLAQKFARRARRTKVITADIIDALHCRALEAVAIGDVDSAETFSRIVAQKTTNDVASLEPCHAKGPTLWIQRLDSTLKDAEAMKRSVDELANTHDKIRSSTVGFDDAVLVGQPTMIGTQQLLLTSLDAGFHEDADPSDWESISENLQNVLQGTASSSVVKDLADVRPYLAQLLVRQTPILERSASIGQLKAVLEALEVVGLSAGGELYLHQCVISAMRLCVSPLLGSQVVEAMASSVVAKSYTPIRKLAAEFIGRVVSKHCDICPELCESVVSLYEHVLQSSPPLGPITGAVYGISELGGTCIERLLVPLLLCEEGLTQHICRIVVQERSAHSKNDSQSLSQDARDCLDAFRAAITSSTYTSDKDTRYFKRGVKRKMDSAIDSTSQPPKNADVFCEAVATAFGTELAML